MKSPAEAVNAHAMVVRSLLGEGDPELARLVQKPFQPSRIMFAGLGSLVPAEEEVFTRLGLRRAGPGDLALNSDPVLQWIEENNIRRLAIHLDVDVLNPRLFRSLQSGNPQADPDSAFRTGEMTFSQLTRLISDAAGQTEVVGLMLAEHMPWDSYNLQKLLAGLPILSGK